MIESGEMLAETWLALKPYIDKKERQDAALAFLRVAENFVDLEGCRKDAKGSDSALDNAFAEILGEDEESEQDDDEEEY
jgi:hypothetical protein